MPELPEVECLTRAVHHELSGATLVKAQFLRSDLRDPIPVQRFRRLLVGNSIDSVWRRSKYMVWQCQKGCGLIHLGMTGNLRLLSEPKPQFKHTHAVFHLRHANRTLSYLHYIDPRRFGRISCCSPAELVEHPYFANLGVEPLEHLDLGDLLFEKSRRKTQSVKTFVMDSRIVVGVGNIYASESLFRAGIDPLSAAGKLTRSRYQLLATHVRATLLDAIACGGTTFRDFKSSDGQPGYFRIKLNVYDRAGEPCRRCGHDILTCKQAGRSTFYCQKCQKR